VAKALDAKSANEGLTGWIFTAEDAEGAEETFVIAN